MSASKCSRVLRWDSLQHGGTTPLPQWSLRDKPALTWPTSLLIQLWQPASSWPGSRFSPLESGLRESQRPAVWSGTHATVNPSTLRPARLSTLSISYSSQERMPPPLPQNKQTEISENTITKKNPQRDLSQSIYKDVTRSYFECKPLAYCRQKKKTEQRERVEWRKAQRKKALDRWKSVLVSTTFEPHFCPSP